MLTFYIYTLHNNYMHNDIVLSCIVIDVDVDVKYGIIFFRIIIGVVINIE